MTTVPATLEAQARVTLSRLHLDISMRAEPDRTTVVVGPNGAGKTTLLRCIAGLTAIEEGRIRIGDVTLDDPARGTFVPPDRRDFGVVFQRDTLFAHMTALDNVAFGLRARGKSKRQAASAARAVLERLGAAAISGSRPGELSGGQRQLVALARAVAVDPRLLLLDEPLSAIDATARPTVRRTLRDMLAGDRRVRILVTHDPTEALALADTVVVMEEGRIVQTGTPGQIVRRPLSRYVAELVGVNLLRGRAERTRIALADGSRIAAADMPPAGEVLAIVRPAAVALHRREPEGSPRNVWRTTVDDLEGDASRVRVRLRAPAGLVAEVTPAAVGELGLAPGASVYATVKATDVAVYPA
jgi:molybdate transport system ATP-binding protein